MPKIRPKHREVLKKISDNVGMPIVQAAKELYSKSYAESGHLQATDSWQELMKEHIPDSKLLAVEKEGLEATKIHSSHTEPDRIVPDYPTRHKYLETGLQLTGKLNKGINIERGIIIPLLGGESNKK